MSKTIVTKDGLQMVLDVLLMSVWDRREYHSFCAWCGVYEYDCEKCGYVGEPHEQNCRGNNAIQYVQRLIEEWEDSNE